MLKFYAFAKFFLTIFSAIIPSIHIFTIFVWNLDFTRVELRVDSSAWIHNCKFQKTVLLMLKVLMRYKQRNLLWKMLWNFTYLMLNRKVMTLQWFSSLIIIKLTLKHHLSLFSWFNFLQERGYRKDFHLGIHIDQLHINTSSAPGSSRVIKYKWLDEVKRKSIRKIKFEFSRKKSYRRWIREQESRKSFENEENFFNKRFQSQGK